MSKCYLVITADREDADLAFCEEEEAYIQLEAIDAHLADGCRVTWLREEVA